MAARYRLSASANQQLDDIYCYTLATWGETQAEHYVHDLFACFEGIANGDVQGRLVQAEFGVTGRYARCGKHFVYWKMLEDGAIGIAEILHERMNIGDHLAGSETLNRDEG